MLLQPRGGEEKKKLGSVCGQDKYFRYYFIMSKLSSSSSPLHTVCGQSWTACAELRFWQAS